MEPGILATSGLYGSSPSPATVLAKLAGSFSVSLAEAQFSAETLAALAPGDLDRRSAFFMPHRAIAFCLCVSVKEGSAIKASSSVVAAIV